MKRGDHEMLADIGGAAWAPYHSKVGLYRAVDGKAFR